MDNGTYEGLDLAPISNDETYSRLRTTPTNSKPRYELQRRPDIDKSAETDVRKSNSKDSQNKAKYSTVLIIVIVILLLSWTNKPISRVLPPG